MLPLPQGLVSQLLDQRETTEAQLCRACAWPPTQECILGGKCEKMSGFHFLQ